MRLLWSETLLTARALPTPRITSGLIRTTWTRLLTASRVTGERDPLDFDTRFGTAAQQEAYDRRNDPQGPLIQMSRPIIDDD